MAYKAGEKVLKKKKDEIWEQNVKNQFIIWWQLYLMLNKYGLNFFLDY